MSYLVGEHVRLCEVTSRPEPVLECGVKAEVDVCLLVGRTVERPGFSLRYTASRSHGIAKQHEMRMRILHPTFLKDALPRLLGIIENKGHKAHFGLFRRIVHRTRCAGRRCRRPASN